MEIKNSFNEVIKNLLKKYTYSSLMKIFIKINSLLIESQKYYLANKLKSCGTNCSFYMPIYVNGAENVEIGDNVSIAPYVHMWGEGGIKIGNRVMIASHTAITSLTHDHHQKEQYKTSIKGKVTIEDDVWIGAHSVILPNITIGKGAVIGAGSVVTKNIEPYSIVFGVPAKHYQYREIHNS
ncbi:MAG: acyltransferase [Cyanobacteriota bacterium]